MNSGLVLLLLGVLAIGVSASPYPSSDWYKDRVARARKFPPAPYSDVTAWNVSGTPRNTMIWTYFHDGDVNGTIAQFVKHPQSITTFSVIAYVCEVDGTFQCMYDQNNKPKGCDFYEPGIRQLQQLLPHAAHMPTISLPPGYIGTGLDLLLASEQLQANFIATALVKALTNNYTGYSIDWEADSDPQLLDAFLTKFKNVLNLKNLTLGYAAVGVDSSLPVNVIQDMGTYGLSGGDLQQTVQNNLAAVGPERYCWGVSADMQTQVSSDFQNMKQLGVVNVCVWDDEIGMMSDDMWQSLADFAQ